MSDPIEAANPLEEAHSHARHHKDEIGQSTVCGCFYCVDTFKPADIADWVQSLDMQPMALCPHCGIDSVIGDASGVPLTKEFLGKMKEYWFEGTVLWPSD